MTTSHELNQRFHDAVHAADVTVDELWIRYFSLGGQASRFELDAYLNAAIALPPLEHDILAQAINERLEEIAPPRAPYSDDFNRADTSEGGGRGEAS